MKLINILSNFNKQQQLSFDLFTKSPFFKLSVDVLSLYKVIAPYFLKGQLNTLNHDKLQKKFEAKYPDHSKTPFNKIASKLVMATDQFLCHYQLENNESQKNEILLFEYKETAQNKAYHKQNLKMVKQLKKSLSRDEAYYLKLSHLQSELYFHPVTNKIETSAADLISDSIINLDRFYILSKLSLAIEMFTRQQSLNEKHSIELLDEITALANKEDSIVIKIYLWLATLLQDGHQHQLFKKLKISFERNLDLFNKNSQATIMQFLINYTNRIYNRGESKYLTYQYELYQLAVKRKLMLEGNNQMLDIYFINVVASFCLNKKFDEAYYFLETNKKYLPRATRQNAVNLSWAYIHFHSGEFEKAWTQVLKTDFDSTVYKIRGRSLLLRCYYEQLTLDKNIAPTLKDSLRNFKKFIYRLSSVSNRMKTLYFNQIIVIRALSTFDPAINKKSVFKKKWQFYLDKNPTVAKRWLIEKIKLL